MTRLAPVPLSSLTTAQRQLVLALIQGAARAHAAKTNPAKSKKAAA